MPRKPPTYADKVRRAFLRGTVHTTPHGAIQAGARTDEEWAAFLDGQQAVQEYRNKRRAREAVRARHPMQRSA